MGIKRNLLKKFFKAIIFYITHPKELSYKIGRSINNVDEYGNIFSKYDFIKKIDLKKPSEFKSDSLIHMNKNSLVLNWVMVDMGIGSGGPMTIFRVINFLEKFGHKNRLYFMESKYMNTQEIKRIISKHYIDISGEIIFGTENMAPCDAIIATAWPSAYPVYSFNKCRAKLYFVQDFEPNFHVYGTEYIMAENTYKMGYGCIAAGAWLNKLMKEKYHLVSDYFDLGVDKNIYKLNNKIKREQNQVCFYAKAIPRRAMELGIMALEKVKKMRPDVKILLYGQEDYHFDIPFEHTNKGVLGFGNLAVLYSKSTIGMVFSLTNYSIVPQEMMACGLPVITNTGENMQCIYKDGQVCFTELFVDAIAANIIDLLDNPNKRESYANKGLSYVMDLSWEKSAKKVEEIILKSLS